MPLPPAVRAERRAKAKLTQETTKKRRVRCDNCNELFEKTRKDHRFCKEGCRKEFFANGGNAFGPLKTRLEKLVRSITGEMERNLTRVAIAVAELRIEIKDLRTSNGADAEAASRAGGKEELRARNRKSTR